MRLTRTVAANLMRIAGYHGDKRAFTRLLIRARISHELALEAWRSGERAKAAGVKCTCIDCAGGAS